jgi:hypothetical protein
VEDAAIALVEQGQKRRFGIEARQAAPEGLGGPWTPQRLRNTLTRYLHGERVVIVANREPYIHERQGDGTVAVVHPASGLVTALEPVMRACSGVWVAHGGGSADRETADGVGRLRCLPERKRTGSGACG